MKKKQLPPCEGGERVGVCVCVFVGFALLWCHREFVGSKGGWKEVEWSHCIRVAPAASLLKGGGGDQGAEGSSWGYRNITVQ